jgi:hypothetical protein
MSLIIPIIAIAGGITMAIVRIFTQARLEELARKERIAAIERGVDPAKLPDVPASDSYGIGSSRLRRAHGLLIGGLILLAIGLGVSVVFAFVEPDKANWIVGVVPGFVGAALLIASRVVWPNQAERARDAGPPGETRY